MLHCIHCIQTVVIPLVVVCACMRVWCGVCVWCVCMHISVAEKNQDNITMQNSELCYACEKVSWLLLISKGNIKL